MPNFSRTVRCRSTLRTEESDVTWHGMAPGKTMNSYQDRNRSFGGFWTPLHHFESRLSTDTSTGVGPGTGLTSRKPCKFVGGRLWEVLQHACYPAKCLNGFWLCKHMHTPKPQTCSAPKGQGYDRVRSDDCARGGLISPPHMTTPRPHEV